MNTKQPENDTMADQPVKSADETAVGEHISFKAMVGKLEDKGKPEDSAKKIAAAIGDKKYGRDRMEKASRLHEPVTKVHEMSTFDGFRSSGHLQSWMISKI